MNKVKDNNIVSKNLKESIQMKGESQILKTPQKSYSESKGYKYPFDWLTEHSRSFLSAGYISSEVTPETRIMEIAKRAEEILRIDR